MSSCNPLIRASISSLARKGGFILKLPSLLVISSEHIEKWCGQTSAVTFMPSSFALLTISTLSLVEQWHKCNVAPVSLANIISRIAITSSTALLIPLTPSSLDLSPKLITPPSTKLMSSQWASTGTLAFAAFFIAFL